MTNIRSFCTRLPNIPSLWNKNVILTRNLHVASLADRSLQCQNTRKIFFPVDGGWNDWTPWTSCPVTCGGGTMNRSRSCTNPSPQNGGANCSGDADDTDICNTNSCPGKCSKKSRFTMPSTA